MNASLVYKGRRFVVGAASFGLVVAGLVVTPAQQAFAGPGDLVSGTVVSDANGSGAVDSTGQVGTNDVGVAGVKVSLCDTSTSTCWTTTTSATGAWNFSATTGAWVGAPGPFAVTIDAAGVNNNVYVTETANGWTAAAGATPQKATSATFDASTQPNDLAPALVKPVWALDLQILSDPSGVGGMSVFTGTPPFDPAGSVDPGTDDSASNDVIRSGDILAMNWSVTGASSGGSLSDQTGPVIFEQTINLSGGAMVTFAQMPSVCKTTGVTPPTQIIAMPSGTAVAVNGTPPDGTTSLVLKCNMGNLGNAAGAATGFLVIEQLKPLGQSPAGSQISTSTRVYAVDPNGAAVATPAPAPVDPGPFTVTSAPKYDVIKKGPYVASWTTTTLPNSPTPQNVFYLDYQLLITVPSKAGIEALKSPITLTEDFWGAFMNSGPTNGTEMTDLLWYVTSCTQVNNMAPTDPYRANRPVNSVASLSTGNDPFGYSSVTNSGTCTYKRSDGATVSSGASAAGPVTLTITGTDTSGKRYPTRSVGSTTDDLANGPYYVASFLVQIMIPQSEIIRAGAAPGNGAGLNVSNQFTGFDPEGLSGASNYGSGHEPGWCADRQPGDPHAVCDQMPGATPTRSDNIVGPYPIYITATGSWGEYVFDKTAGWTYNYGNLPSMVSGHDGAGQVAPGTTYMGMLNLNDASAGVVPIDLAQTIGGCQVFDNRMAKLAPLSQVQWLNGTTANQVAQKAQLTSTTNPYAAVIVVNALTITNPPAVEPGLQNDFTFEYGVADLTGDVSNNGVFDPVTGRYGGVWTAQRTVNCGDGLSNITWYSDPSLVPGGIDAVNAVRFVSKPGIPAGTVTATTLSFQIGLQQRDTFYQVAPGGVGMVDTGTVIPAGTVFAVFGRPLYDRVQKDTAGNAVWWTGRNYVPQPENGNTDGDRWTVVRAVASITVDTITVPTPNPGPSDPASTDGAAGVGSVGTASAGNPVVWRVMPQISPAIGMPAGGTVSNVVVTATIPKTATYDPSKTAQLTGGTPADSVVTNPDGSVTLSWNLGTWTVGTPIPPRIIYTTTDPMAPSPTSIVVPVTIRSSSITVASPMGLTNHEPTTNPATWTWPLTSTVSHTVNMTQPARIQVKLATDGTQYLTDTPQSYTATIANFADTVSFAAPTIYDKLPVVGDGGSTVAPRSPVSDFAGTAVLTGPVTATNKNGAPVSGTVYYWTGPAADMPERPEDDTYPMDGSGPWKTYAQLTAAGMTLNNVTGWKFVDSNPLPPSTDPNSIINLKFQLQPTGNQAGDMYANRFTAFSDTLKSGGTYQVQASNETLIGVLGFSLGDLIWFDTDHNGKYTPGVDVPAAGVTVQVHLVYNGADTVVATPMTDANGRWLVNSLDAPELAGAVASGQYYALIPASEFQQGGPLYGYRVAPHSQQPDTTTAANEDTDHNAFSTATGAAATTPGAVQPGDVWTPIVKLSAQINPLTNVVQRGLLPIGDNTGGLATPNPQLITDDYTNFTLDMALESVGTFKVTKAWTGSVPPWTGGVEPTYSGAWDCQLAGTSIASGTWSIQGTGDVTMVTTAGQDPTDITAGAICKASETMPGAAAMPDAAWVWNSPTYSADVTILPDVVDGTGNPVETINQFTVTNSADELTGEFNVVKTWSGTVPPWVATTVFTGTWACQNSTENIDASGAWSRTGLGAATLTGLPAVLPIGTTCTAAENVDGDGLPTAALPTTGVWVWAPPTVDPATAVTVVADTTVVVTVTNLAGGYAFSKTASPASGTIVPVGTPITYTLVGENTGDEVLTVNIDDDLSAVLNHATLTTAPAAAIVGGDGTNVPAVPALAGTAESWSGTLNPGEKVTITYTVTPTDYDITINNAALSEAYTPDEQLLPGQGATTHRTPPRPVPANTGGAVVPSAPGWLPPLLFATGLVVLLVRRRGTLWLRS